jgi:hypothetical protein
VPHDEVLPPPHRPSPECVFDRRSTSGVRCRSFCWANDLACLRHADARRTVSLRARRLRLP